MVQELKETNKAEAAKRRDNLLFEKEKLTAEYHKIELEGELEMNRLIEKNREAERSDTAKFEE